MHPQHATRRLDVLHTRLDEHRAALVDWLDTLDRHLYRLYLITGSDDCLIALSRIERVRGGTTALDPSAAWQPALQELTRHLDYILLMLAGQFGDNDGSKPLPSGKGP